MPSGDTLPHVSDLFTIAEPRVPAQPSWFDALDTWLKVLIGAVAAFVSYGISAFLGILPNVLSPGALDTPKVGDCIVRDDDRIVPCGGYGAELQVVAIVPQTGFSLPDADPCANVPGASDYEVWHNSHRFFLNPRKRNYLWLCVRWA